MRAVDEERSDQKAYCIIRDGKIKIKVYRCLRDAQRSNYYADHIGLFMNAPTLKEARRLENNRYESDRKRYKKQFDNFKATIQNQ